MIPLLKRYRAALVKRINDETFVRIFERALGRGLTGGGGGSAVLSSQSTSKALDRPYSARPDLWLVQTCLAYMDAHINSLCSREDPIRTQDVVALFHDALGQIFFG